MNGSKLVTVAVGAVACHPIRLQHSSRVSRTGLVMGLRPAARPSATSP